MCQILAKKVVIAIAIDISNILAQFYTDRMTVRRYQQRIDSDGAVAVALDPVPVLEDIPCRVSYSGKDSPTISNDTNPISQRLGLFCRPEVPLQSGDFVSIKRGETELYTGRIGKPSRYDSSLQVLFQQEENS